MVYVINQEKKINMNICERKQFDDWQVGIGWDKALGKLVQPKFIYLDLFYHEAKDKSFSILFYFDGLVYSIIIIYMDLDVGYK